MRTLGHRDVEAQTRVARRPGCQWHRINTIFQDLQDRNLAANAAQLVNPMLSQLTTQWVPYAQEFTNPSVVFTDDKAPVEQVVHGLILSFVSGG